RANISVTDGILSSIAQRAIATASLAGLRALERLKIVANVAVGHSLGEITSLYWAGAFAEETFLRIATLREKAMGDLRGVAGGMVAIEAPAAEVATLLD